jgi:hypothetical protein
MSSASISSCLASAARPKRAAGRVTALREAVTPALAMSDANCCDNLRPLKTIDMKFEV